MTVINTTPHMPAAVAEISRFGRPAASGARTRTASFLAPAATPDQSPVRRASDRGEKAMHRLRNPFAALIG